MSHRKVKYTDARDKLGNLSYRNILDPAFVRSRTESKCSQKGEKLDLLGLHKECAGINLAFQKHCQELSTRMDGCEKQTKKPVPIKGKVRAMYKFIYKYKYDARELTDIVRTSFIFEDAPSLWKAVETIDNEFAPKITLNIKYAELLPRDRDTIISIDGIPFDEARAAEDVTKRETASLIVERKGVTGGVLRMKDRLNNPPASGYSDVLLNVRYKDIVCEVQLHLRTFYDLKNGSTGQHKNYKKARHFGAYFDTICFPEH